MVRKDAVHEAARNLLWQQFMILFPRDEDCIEQLVQLVLSRGIASCRCCHNREFRRSYGDSIGWCTECSAKNWLLSQTLFYRMKRPRAWWLALWFAERRVVLNSCDLSELAGVSTATALNILWRIEMALLGQLQDDLLEVPSSLFASAIGKRSRQTPAGLHPRLEEPEFRQTKQLDECAAELNEASVDAASRRPVNDVSSKGPEAAGGDLAAVVSTSERAILELLSVQPMSFDMLSERAQMAIGELSATLTMLELGGVIRSPFANHYARVENSNSPVDSGVNTQSFSSTILDAVASAVEAITTHCQRISRKYLQLYVARCAYFLRHRANAAGMTVSEACARAGPITYGQIIAYVTPPVVKLAAL